MNSQTNVVKILGFVLIAALAIVAAWLFMRSQQNLDPQKVLAELTLGEALELENSTQGLDPTKEELRVFEVAPNQEVALREGVNLVMSRQSLISYYEKWLSDNNWSLTYSRELIPGVHDILGRKEGQGLLKISITGSEQELSSIMRVSIMYGYGR